MKIARTVVITSLVVFGLAGCNKSVEGTYHLDKEATHAAVEAKLAKMPAAQRAIAETVAQAMISRMDVSITLQPGGKLVTTVTFTGSKKDKAGQVTKKGTWKVKGDQIIIDSAGKPSTCTKVSKGIRCESGVPGTPPFVFLRS